MRKNDLIKLLNNIEGNPDVVLWNGMVEDYMHIDKPERIPFRRMSVKRSLKYINYERVKDGKPEMSLNELKECISKGTAARDDYIISDRNDIYDECKPMIVLQGKSRCKTVYDRIGKISY